MATSTGFASQTQTLTGTGSTPPIFIFPPGFSRIVSQGFLIPSIGLLITGTLSTSVYWTGDDYTNPNWSAATANWFPFTGLSAITASTATSIGAAMTAIRATNNSGTGTLVLQVCEQSL